MIYSLISIACALLLAPLYTGVINRVKALMAGRRGPPLLQLYYDIYKLLHKGAVYSRTTGLLFKTGPVVSLAALLAILALLPAGGHSGLFSFSGDILVVAYFLAISRFFTVLAALDTGSSFEGMGASREMQFGLLLEPAFFCVFAALARLTGSLDLSGIYAGLSPASWLQATPVLLPVTAVLFIALLVENARIPIDDPSTHLELTMIHEVMILDHSGPDLALLEYAASLKIWISATLLAGILCPLHSGTYWIDMLVFLMIMGLTATLAGMLESTMARLRLIKIPHLLTGTLALAALSFIVQIR